jgi:hypothetical protein
MYTASAYLFLSIGGIILVWSLLILLSQHFYTWWETRYWKQTNDEHLRVNNVIYNRYGTGIGMLVLGIVIIWAALSF